MVDGWSTSFHIDHPTASRDAVLRPGLTVVAEQGSFLLPWREQHSQPVLLLVVEAVA
jgi:hypothetical protein